MAWQHPERTSQPHEGDGHLRRSSAIFAGVIWWIALGGKLKDMMGVKTHHFVAGLRPPDWLAVRIEALQDAHGLKEIKPVSFLEEDSFYRRICSPALGGHRFKGSSRCWVVAISLGKRIERRI